MMQILAPVENIRFDLEDALDKQMFAVPLPFNGMDKSALAICELFARSACDKGNLCAYRHVRGDKSVVCKHWLRGLCKKGDECEFLHEYDMSKMPECFFYSKYGQCGNKECEFLHLDRESKIKDCPWYDRGFCRHGPNCKNRHVKKVICQNYLFGFCLDGPNCKFKHPKFELPVSDSATQQKKQIYVCDFCGEKGHKITSCFKLNPENRQLYQSKQASLNMMRESFQQQDPFGHSMGGIHQPMNVESKNEDGKNENAENGSKSNNVSDENKPAIGFQANPSAHPNFYNQNRPNFHHAQNAHFQPQFGAGMHHANGAHQHFANFVPPYEVTCFKCGEKGHYANKCPKGVAAFLRSSNNDHSIAK